MYLRFPSIKSNNRSFEASVKVKASSVITLALIKFVASGLYRPTTCSSISVHVNQEADVAAILVEKMYKIALIEMRQKAWALCL